jgi:hypothetical protein
MTSSPVSPAPCFRKLRTVARGVKPRLPPPPSDAPQAPPAGGEAAREHFAVSRLFNGLQNGKFRLRLQPLHSRARAAVCPDAHAAGRRASRDSNRISGLFKGLQHGKVPIIFVASHSPAVVAAPASARGSAPWRLARIIRESWLAPARSPPPHARPAAVRSRLPELEVRG